MQTPRLCKVSNKSLLLVMEWTLTPMLITVLVSNKSLLLVMEWTLPHVDNSASSMSCHVVRYHEARLIVVGLTSMLLLLMCFSQVRSWTNNSHTSSSTSRSSTFGGQRTVGVSFTLFQSCWAAFWRSCSSVMPRVTLPTQCSLLHHECHRPTRSCSWYYAL